MQIIDEMPEIVQLENGDLIDSMVDSFQAPTDLYANLRVQISQCAGIPEISALYRGLSVEVRGIVADDIRKRQDELRAAA